MLKYFWIIKKVKINKSSWPISRYRLWGQPHLPTKYRNLKNNYGHYRMDLGYLIDRF
jgi:hypothetical protein